MSKRKIKQYTKEFKESAIRLAIESRQPIAQTARELGIQKATLYIWMRKNSQAKEPVGMSDSENPYEQIKMLRKEVARISEERDILKKATAYFAKESR